MSVRRRINIRSWCVDCSGLYPDGTVFFGDTAHASFPVTAVDPESMMLHYLASPQCAGARIAFTTVEADQAVARYDAGEGAPASVLGN